jgi:hypothetical protein
LGQGAQKEEAAIGRKNEEEMLGIQKRDGSGSSKSATPIEMKAVAIERIERTAEGLHTAHETGSNWILMR